MDMSDADELAKAEGREVQKTIFIGVQQMDIGGEDDAFGRHMNGGDTNTKKKKPKDKDEGKSAGGSSSS